MGYNLRRKVILLTIWILSPLVFLLSPSLFGLLEPHHSFGQFMRHVGYLWLFVGIGGLLFRTLHLFLISGPQTGLVWATKILTDPFHDIKLYHRAPASLLRERFAHATGD